MGKEEIAYVEAIEDLFLVLRKQGLMLSPADRDCARRWFRDGIPLHRAAQSIVDEVDLFRDKKPAGMSLPHMLSYYSDAVYRAEKTANTVLLTHDEVAETEENSESMEEDSRLAQTLKRIETVGKDEKHPHIREAYRSLYKRLRTWERARQNTGLGPWLRLMHEQEILLMQDILDGLSDEEKHSLDMKVQKRFSEEKKGLGKKARLEKMQWLWREELRHHFGILDLRDGEEP